MNTGIRLFCIPYAGGSASVYFVWKKYLDTNIEIYPIELSGRGRRMNVPLYNDMNDAVNDIYELIKNDLDDKPYAIFGHSMGCYLAFELYYKIMESNHQSAKHVFFSGRAAPGDDSGKKYSHLLPDNEFIREVYSLGGMAEEFLKNKILKDVFLPILRADYKMIETYEYTEKKSKICCSISVLTGTRDKLTKGANISKWSTFTNNKCYFYEFDGGHFFINSCLSAVVSIVNQRLLDLIR
ncbi:MAG: thioesterase II family protein [Caulobacteraceae bacterium]